MRQLEQALILTHESAPPDLWEPYLGHLLRPLRPLVLFGRDASLQPCCPHDCALFFGWRDTVAKMSEFPFRGKSAGVP